MDSQKTVNLYDAYYYATGCGPTPYERSEVWLSLFDSMAKQIIDEIDPKSALDVGCGMGFLVEALRQRGIEAFGLDISDYAIQQAHPDIQPYCWVGSATEPLPRRYDLLICIEVLEHLSHPEAKQAVENLCRYSDDIIFSSSPFDYKEPTHFNVQPPEYWAELFAQHGFFRDVDFDASFITPWAVRFRKVREPVSRVIAIYERKLWQLLQENQARRELSIEQRNELSKKEDKLVALSAENEALGKTLQTEREGWKRKWESLEQSVGWPLLQKLQRTRARFFPPKSVRDQCLDDVILALRTRKVQPLFDAFYRARQDLARILKIYLWQMRLRLFPIPSSRLIQIEDAQTRPPVQVHQVAVDIIICIHNALDDVKNCLESVLRHSTPPYQLILVDDGSDGETQRYLTSFAQQHDCALLRNDQPRGYTLAANQGLRHSSADYALLLNSDTIVTPRWLDRLLDCAESDPRIGLVGPLSNTASWQSIPEIETNGDWATNPLPSNLDIEQMGQLVAQYSARLYPLMPFLNGFCLLIRRQTLQEVGYFDEENFGAGYGEENDYALRARKADWQLALADNTYIYHAQSRSYSHESRQRLSQQANLILAKKYGQQLISEGVTICRYGRVFEGIRARSRVMLARREWIDRGKAMFAGRRVLFVLPLPLASGGGNVIIDEALAMREMGIDVHIFNLNKYRDAFQQAYPELPIPVHYGEDEGLANIAYEYDALVATFHLSVKWLASIGHQAGGPRRGYYVQDFEPYLYSSSKSYAFRQAWQSYTLFPDLRCFTKTQWNAEEVKRHTGAACEVIGVSFNLDLFQPRPRPEPEWPERPLKIVAMVRTTTHYRGPQQTMQILQKASKKYGGSVQIIIFGTDLKDAGFADLPRRFAWQSAGILRRKQVAQLLNEADIFVDFSSHQAMGLTALEAMACGAAVIVPQQGGATTFARHEQNSLVIDTTSPDECWAALSRLIEDHQLRARLQRSAIIDVCNYYPERPAFNILNYLFGSSPAKLK